MLMNISLTTFEARRLARGIYPTPRGSVRAHRTFAPENAIF